MSNQLAIRDNEIALTDLGTILAKSGFFSDTRDAAQAIVKVLAGRELGFGPIASMTGVHIIKGRPALSANLMAAAVKRTSKYNYRLIEHTDTACELAFFEDKQEVGRSRFTAEDAKKAGTQNMDKFPRNMLFARAMSNGVKWFCPDIFGGPIYTPEELGASVNEDGEVLAFPEVKVIDQHNGAPDGVDIEPEDQNGSGTYDAETGELLPVTKQEYWDFVKIRLGWDGIQAGQVAKQFNNDYGKALESAKKQIPA
jgi:hypothetical protein